MKYTLWREEPVCLVCKTCDVSAPEFTEGEINTETDVNTCNDLVMSCHRTEENHAHLQVFDFLAKAKWSFFTPKIDSDGQQ